MRKEGIPFDGFGSVLEMLRRSDSIFREKILHNLRRRDPHLAKRLEAGLRNLLARDNDSRATLEKSQRSATARSYGQN